ncbi:titin homolog [Ceratina calcarata]|uniref:Titin homolog n=1 Tax=Ceratina calcarata TaxID=156304 RepID=A0AAJ7S405_9HYME|nr:titin homolog [Ceratina calcarata]
MTLTDQTTKAAKGPPRWLEPDQVLPVQGRVGEDIVVKPKLRWSDIFDELRFELTRGDVPMPSDRYRIQMRGNVVQLTLKQSQKEDTGHYALVATRVGQGFDKGSSKKIHLNVDEVISEEGEPPVFLRRLTHLAVKVGTRTRFLVEIRSSTTPKVTWHRNADLVHAGSRFSFVHEGNFYCVDVAPVTVEDEGDWTCMAENRGGRSSCTSRLTVIVPKAYKRPEFVEELRALLTETGTVSLECKVVGVPTPVLRWFKDDKEIKAGDVFALTANPDDPTSLGIYTCEAVNCMGIAYSSSKVHVVGKGSREGSLKPADSMTPSGPLPVFAKILQDECCRIGDTLRLSCKVQVPPWPKAITWYNKEGRIEPSEKYHVMEDGLGGYFIEVNPVEAMDEGEWKCVATSTEDMKQFTTCYVAMSIPKNYRKPRFMESLKAVLTEEGLVSFECKVVGFPTPLLRWFKDGQELKPGDVYQLTGTNSLGSYCCIARNCMGEAKSTAELTIEDIQNQLNEEERMQLLSTDQPPMFVKGLRSCEARINEDFRFTVQVSISPEPSLAWYRDDMPVEENDKYQTAKENLGTCHLDVRKLEFVDQGEWKCVASNDNGQSVTSCFLKLIIPKHYKKPKFLESLRAILSEEGAVNLECKVIGVPQPVLKWYKDGVELKPGDIHRIISGQDGTCCLGTYTCEATNCMGTVSSSASLLGFEDKLPRKEIKEPLSPNGHELARNLSLSTIHEERTSQLYDTPQTDHSVTLDDRGEVSFSFDGKEVSVSLYETPDLTEEEALQIVEMYADQLSEHVTEHNVIELPPMRFVKESSNSGNLLMEAVVIDVSPDYFVSAEDGDDLRTEADFEDVSILDDITRVLSSPEQDSRSSLKRSAGYSLEDDDKPPTRPPRKKSSSSSKSEKSEKSLKLESESFHSAQREEPFSPVSPISPVSSLKQDDSDTFADVLSSARLSISENQMRLDENGRERKRSLSVDKTAGSSIDDGIGGDSSFDSVTGAPKKKRHRRKKHKRDKGSSEESSIGSEVDGKRREGSAKPELVQRIESISKTEEPYVEVEKKQSSESEKSLSKSNKERLLDNMKRLKEPVLVVRDTLVKIDNLETKLNTGSEDECRMIVTENIIRPIQSLCEEVSTIESKALKNAGDRSLNQTVRISLLEAIGGPTEELLRGMELIERQENVKNRKTDLIAILESLTDPVDEILMGITKIEHELTGRARGERPIVLIRMTSAVFKLDECIRNVLSVDKRAERLVASLENILSTLDFFLNDVSVDPAKGTIETVDTVVVESLSKSLEDMARSLSRFSSTEVKTEDITKIIDELMLPTRELKAKLDTLKSALETYESKGILSEHRTKLIESLQDSVGKTIDEIRRTKDRKTVEEQKPVIEGTKQDVLKEVRLSLQEALKSYENIAGSLDPRLSTIFDRVDEIYRRVKSPQKRDIGIESLVSLEGPLNSLQYALTSIAISENSETIFKLLQPAISQLKSTMTNLEESSLQPTLEMVSNIERIVRVQEQEETISSRSGEEPQNLPEKILDPLIDVQSALSTALQSIEDVDSVTNGAAGPQKILASSEVASCLIELRQYVSDSAHTAMTLKEEETLISLAELKEPLMELQSLLISENRAIPELPLIRKVGVPVEKLKAVVSKVLTHCHSQEMITVIKSVSKVLEEIETQLPKTVAKLVEAEEATKHYLQGLNVDQNLSNVHFALSSALERHERSSAAYMSSLTICVEDLRQSIGSSAVAIANLKNPIDDQIIEQIYLLKESLLSLQRSLLTQEHEPEEEQLLKDLLKPIEKMKGVVQNIVDSNARTDVILPVLELLEEIEKDTPLIAKEASKKRAQREAEKLMPKEEPKQEKAPTFILADRISRSLDPMKRWLSTTSEESNKEEEESALSSTVEELKRDVNKIAIETSYSEPPSDENLIEALIELKEPLMRLRNAISMYHEPVDLTTLEGLSRPMKQLLQTVMDVLRDHAGEESLRPIVDIVEEIGNQIPISIKEALYRRELKQMVKSMTHEEVGTSQETIQDESIPQETTMAHTSQETIPESTLESTTIFPETQFAESIIEQTTVEDISSKVTEQVVTTIEDSPKVKEQLTEEKRIEQAMDLIVSLSRTLETVHLDVTGILDDFEQPTTGTTITPISLLGNSLEELRKTISNMRVTTESYANSQYSYEEVVGQTASVLENLQQPLNDLQKVLQQSHQYGAQELYILDHLIQPLSAIESEVINHTVKKLEDSDLKRSCEPILNLLRDIKDTIPIVAKDIHSRQELLGSLREISKPLENIQERMKILETQAEDMLETDVARILVKPLDYLLDTITATSQEVQLLDQRRDILFELRSLVEPLVEFLSSLSVVQSSRRSLVPEVALLDERRSVILKSVEGLQKQSSSILEKISNLEGAAPFKGALSMLQNATVSVQKQIGKTDYSRKSSTVEFSLQYNLSSSFNHLRNTLATVEESVDSPIQEVISKSLEALQKQITLSQTHFMHISNEQPFDDEAIVEGFLYPTNQLQSALNTLKEKIVEKVIPSVSVQSVAVLQALATSTTELASSLSLHRVQLIREGASEGSSLVETLSAVVDMLQSVKDSITAVQQVAVVEDKVKEVKGEEPKVGEQKDEEQNVLTDVPITITHIDTIVDEIIEISKEEVESVLTVEKLSPEKEIEGTEKVTIEQKLPELTESESQAALTKETELKEVESVDKIKEEKIEASGVMKDEKVEGLEIVTEEKLKASKVETLEGMKEEKAGILEEMNEEKGETVQALREGKLEAEAVKEEKVDAFEMTKRKEAKAEQVEEMAKAEEKAKVQSQKIEVSDKEVLEQKIEILEKKEEVEVSKKKEEVLEEQAQKQVTVEELSSEKIKEVKDEESVGEVVTKKESVEVASAMDQEIKGESSEKVEVKKIEEQVESSRKAEKVVKDEEIKEQSIDIIKKEEGQKTEEPTKTKEKPEEEVEPEKSKESLQILSERTEELVIKEETAEALSEKTEELAKVEEKVAETEKIKATTEMAEVLTAEADKTLKKTETELVHEKTDQSEKKEPEAVEKKVDQSEKEKQVKDERAEVEESKIPEELTKQSEQIPEKKLEISQEIESTESVPENFEEILRQKEFEELAAAKEKAEKEEKQAKIDLVQKIASSIVTIEQPFKELTNLVSIALKEPLPSKSEEEKRKIRELTALIQILYDLKTISPSIRKILSSPIPEMETQFLHLGYSLLNVEQATGKVLLLTEKELMPALKENVMISLQILLEPLQSLQRELSSIQQTTTQLPSEYLTLSTNVQFINEILGKLINEIRKTAELKMKVVEEIKVMRSREESLDIEESTVKPLEELVEALMISPEEVKPREESIVASIESTEVMDQQKLISDEVTKLETSLLEKIVNPVETLREAVVQIEQQALEHAETLDMKSKKTATAVLNSVIHPLEELEHSLNMSTQQQIVQTPEIAEEMRQNVPLQQSLLLNIVLEELKTSIATLQEELVLESGEVQKPENKTMVKEVKESLENLKLAVGTVQEIAATKTEKVERLSSEEKTLAVETFVKSIKELGEKCLAIISQPAVIKKPSKDIQNEELEQILEVITQPIQLLRESIETEEQRVEEIQMLDETSKNVVEVLKPLVHPLEELEHALQAVVHETNTSEGEKISEIKEHMKGLVLTPILEELQKSIAVIEEQAALQPKKLDVSSVKREASVAELIDSPLESLKTAVAAIQTLETEEAKELSTEQKTAALKTFAKGVEEIGQVLSVVSGKQKPKISLLQQPQIAKLEEFEQQVLEAIASPIQVLRETVSKVDEQQTQEVAALMPETKEAATVLHTLVEPLEQLEKSLSVAVEQISTVKEGSTGDLGDVQSSVKLNVEPVLEELQKSIAVIQEQVLFDSSKEKSEKLDTSVAKVIEEPLEHLKSSVAAVQEIICLQTEETTELSNADKTSIIQSFAKSVKEIGEKCLAIISQQQVGVALVPKKLEESQLEILEMAIGPLHVLRETINKIEEGRLQQVELLDSTQVKESENALKTLIEPLRELETSLTSTVQKAVSTKIEEAEEMSETPAVSTKLDVSPMVEELQKCVATVQEQIKLQTATAESTEKVSLMQTAEKSLEDLNSSLAIIQSVVTVESSREEKLSDTEKVTALQEFAKSVQQLEECSAVANQQQVQTMETAKELTESEKLDVRALETIVTPVHTLRETLTKMQEEVATLEPENVSAGTLTPLVHPLEKLEKCLINVVQQVNDQKIETVEEMKKETPQTVVLQPILEELKESIVTIQEQLIVSPQAAKLEVVKNIIEAIEELKTTATAVQQVVGISEQAEELKTEKSVLEAFAKSLDQLEERCSAVASQRQVEQKLEEHKKQQARVDAETLQKISSTVHVLRESLSQIEEGRMQEAGELKVPKEQSELKLNVLIEPLNVLEQALTNAVQKGKIVTEEIAEELKQTDVPVEKLNLQPLLEELQKSIAIVQQQASETVSVLTEDAEINIMKAAERSLEEMKLSVAAVQEIASVKPEEIQAGEEKSRLEAFARTVEEAGEKLLAVVRQQEVKEAMKEVSPKKKAEDFVKSVIEPISELQNTILTMDKETELVGKKKEKEAVVLLSIVQPLQKLEESFVSAMKGEAAKYETIEEISQAIPILQELPVKSTLEELNKNVAEIQEQLVLAKETLALSGDTEDFAVMKKLERSVSNLRTSIAVVQQLTTIKEPGQQILDVENTSALEAFGKAMGELKKQCSAVISRPKVIAAIIGTVQLVKPMKTEVSESILVPTKILQESICIIEEIKLQETGILETPETKKPVAMLSELISPLQQLEQSFVAAIQGEHVTEHIAEAIETDKVSFEKISLRPILEEFQKSIAAIQEQMILEEGVQSMSEGQDASQLKTMAQTLTDLKTSVAAMQQITEPATEFANELSKAESVTAFETFAKSLHDLVERMTTIDHQQMIMEPAADTISEDASSLKTWADILEESHVQVTGPMVVDQGSIESPSEMALSISEEEVHALQGLAKPLNELKECLAIVVEERKSMDANEMALSLSEKEDLSLLATMAQPLLELKNAAVSVIHEQTAIESAKERSFSDDEREEATLNPLIQPLEELCNSIALIEDRMLVESAEDRQVDELALLTALAEPLMTLQRSISVLEERVMSPDVEPLPEESTNWITECLAVPLHEIEKSIAEIKECVVVEPGVAEEQPRIETPDWSVIEKLVQPVEVIKSTIIEIRESEEAGMEVEAVKSLVQPLTEVHESFLILKGKTEMTVEEEEASIDAIVDSLSNLEKSISLIEEQAAEQKFSNTKEAIIKTLTEPLMHLKEKIMTVEESPNVYLENLEEPLKELQSAVEIISVTERQKPRQKKETIIPVEETVRVSTKLVNSIKEINDSIDSIDNKIESYKGLLGIEIQIENEALKTLSKSLEEVKKEIQDLSQKTDIDESSTGCLKKLRKAIDIVRQQSADKPVAEPLHLETAHVIGILRPLTSSLHELEATTEKVETLWKDSLKGEGLIELETPITNLMNDINVLRDKLLNMQIVWETDEKQKKKKVSKKQKETEEEEIKKKQEAETKKREQEEKLKQQEEDRKKEEETKKLQVEEELKRKEEAEKAKQQEEEIQKKKEAEKLKQEEERKEKEEAEKLKQEEERKKKEEAEKLKLEEERKKQEEAEKLKQEEERKKKEEAEKLKLEEERKKQEEAEKLKQEEERKKKEEAEKLKLEEERKKQEEAEKLKQEEERKKKEEAEKLKLEEERKKQEEAEKLKQEEERKKKEEAEKLKLEEERKKQEEAEKLKQEEERKKKEEAEKLKLEEERKKQEEAEKLKQEEERKKKEEAEKLKLEEERKKQEEAEKLKQEEERKKKEEAEKLKLEEERKKQEEAEKLKQEEERKKKEEAEKLKLEEERKKQEEAEKLKQEEERKKKEEAEKLKLEEERKKQEEAEKLKQEEERKKKEEAEKLKLEEERKKQEETEKLMQEEELKKKEETIKSKQEEKRKKKEKAEKLKQEEEERKAKEEAEKLKQEQERKKKEESEKLIQEEERKKKEEAEKLKQEEERKKKEEAEKLNQEEAHKKKQAAEKLKQEERKKKEDAEKLRAEKEKRKKEEEDKTLKEQKEKQEKEAAEKKKQEEVARKQKEEEEKLRQEKIEESRKAESEALKQKEEKLRKKKEERKLQQEEDERKDREEAEKRKLEQEERKRERKERARKEEEERLNREEEERKKKEKRAKLKKEEEERRKAEDAERLRKEHERDEMRREEARRRREDQEKQIRHEAEKVRKTEEERLRRDDEIREHRRQEREHRRHEEEAKLRKEEEERTKREDERRRKRKEAEKQWKEDEEAIRKKETERLEKRRADERQKKEEAERLRREDEDKRRRREAERQLRREESAREMKEEEERLRRRNEEEASRIRQRRQEQLRDDTWTKWRQSDSDHLFRKMADDALRIGKTKTVSSDMDFYRDRRDKSYRYDSGFDSGLSSTSRSYSWRDSLTSLTKKRVDDFLDYRLRDTSIDRYYFDTGSYYRRRRKRDDRMTRARSISLLKYDDYSTGDSDSTITAVSISKPPRYSRTKTIARTDFDDRGSNLSIYLPPIKDELMPRVKGKKPSFCTRLTNRTVGVGMRVRLTCTVLGHPEPRVYWMKDGEKLDITSNKYKTRFDNGMAYFELHEAHPDDSGLYTCVAENVHGIASTESALKVYPDFQPALSPPTFTRSIKDTYRHSDNELILECRVRGNPMPIISWLKDGCILQGDRFKQCYLDDGIYRLEIAAPNSSDGGRYTCRAMNDLRTEEIHHIVQFDERERKIIGKHEKLFDDYFNIEATRKPRFSNYLTDHTVPTGGTIALQVEVKGVPAPEVRWFRGERREPVSVPKAKTFTESGVHTLVLPEVTESEKGTYICRAINAFGHADTVANIEVISPSATDGGKPAMFVSRPVDKSITVTTDEDVSVSFRFSGTPKPRVIWMKGLTDITDGPRSYKETVNDYVRLTLKRVTSSDEGTYCILLKNRYGCDRSFFSIKVKQRARSLTPDWSTLSSRTETGSLLGLSSDSRDDEYSHIRIRRG